MVPSCTLIVPHLLSQNPHHNQLDGSKVGVQGKATKLAGIQPSSLQLEGKDGRGNQTPTGSSSHHLRILPSSIMVRPCEVLLPVDPHRDNGSNPKPTSLQAPPVRPGDHLLHEVPPQRVGGPPTVLSPPGAVDQW
eukprot:GGOE01061681.1.p3 GENE.GGOE01061681.1~~GGOE01061681.1.p3  ORF type:complete len:135 (+),score=32.64 GGOE01061681.1:356-760(+)